MMKPILMMLPSLVLLALGLVLLERSQRRAAAERVEARLALAGSSDSGRAEPGFIGRLLLRAGISLPRRLGLTLLVLALGLLLLLSRFGWWIPLLALAVGLLLLLGLANWRAQQRLDRMVAQTPSMLDHMVRSIHSGRTLSDALLMAADQCQPPLRDALAPVRRDMTLGVPLGDAMTDMARLYDRDELQILAMGIRINQRHGGNVADLLQSLISLIRDRESASRQLRALTGETRISAVVLAVLPIALGGYILLSNPDFLQGLWYSSTGRILLLLSLLLQGTGCVLLWRMLKSI